jgi:hypothetical protein
LGQGYIDHSTGIQVDPAETTAIAVKRSGNPIIGGPNDWDALFYGSYASLMQVLARACRIAEPPVICNVNHQSRSFRALNECSRKDRLVADERQGGG